MAKLLPSIKNDASEARLRSKSPTKNFRGYWKIGWLSGIRVNQTWNGQRKHAIFALRVKFRITLEIRESNPLLTYILLVGNE